jgi:hypothetical protein
MEWHSVGSGKSRVQEKNSRTLTEASGLFNAEIPARKDLQEFELPIVNS